MSKKQNGLKKNQGRLDDLESMVEFANADIGSMNVDRLNSLIAEYVNFVMADVSASPFSDFAKRHYLFVKDILGDDASEQSVNKVKKVLLAIQSHLQSRFRTIMVALEEKEDTVLWEFKGTVRFIYNTERDQLVTEYDPAGDKTEKKLDLETERRLVDTRLVEIVRDLGFQKNIAGIDTCSRNTCGRFFFKLNRRTYNKKIYCSEKCAKAEAREKFRMKAGKH